MLVIDSAPRNPASTEHESSEWRSGWRTLIASFMGYGTGALLFLTTAGLFVQPMKEATGWSTTQVMIGPAAAILWGCTSPLVGLLTRKIGSRATALTGLMVVGSAFILFAVIPTERAYIYGITALIGLVGGTAYLVPFARGLSTWFHQKSGTAFGIMTSGGSIFGVIATPLTALVIYNVGWKSGYLVPAAFVLLLCLPTVFLLFRENPAQTGATTTIAAPDGAATSLNEAAGPEGKAPTNALRDWRYWVLVLAFAAWAFVVAAFLGNLQPMLLESGISVAAATTMTTTFLLASCVGSVLGGVMLDVAWPYLVAFGLAILSALGTLVFITLGADTPTALLAVAVILVGFGMGAEANFSAYFVHTRFRGQDFSVLFAVAFGVVGLCGSIGPFVFAAIRDITGDYHGASVLSAVLFVLMGVAVLTVGITDRLRPGDEKSVDQNSNTPTPLSEGV